MLLAQYGVLIEWFHTYTVADSRSRRRFEMHTEIQSASLARRGYPLGVSYLNICVITYTFTPAEIFLDAFCSFFRFIILFILSGSTLVCDNGLDLSDERMWETTIAKQNNNNLYTYIKEDSQHPIKCSLLSFGTNSYYRRNLTLVSTPCTPTAVPGFDFQILWGAPR